MRLPWRRTGAARRPRNIWRDWKSADAAGDATRAGELAEEMLSVAPDSFAAWFEAGLYSKSRRNWRESVQRNSRALELFGSSDADDYDGANPAAWNLGIAATATGDWETARRAWTSYGIEGLAEGTGPIEVDLGMTPIRLNPDNLSLPHQVSFNVGDTEVVWCLRRSPAHAVIASVPLPESGHRFGDVLLPDGEPKGTRRVGDQEFPVFDELERLEESDQPTWQAILAGALEGDLDRLSDILHSAGLGMDEWSRLRILCIECSHGSPDDDHQHGPIQDNEHRLGLAGHEEQLRPIMDAWLKECPHVSLLELCLLW